MTTAGRGRWLFILSLALRASVAAAGVAGDQAISADRESRRASAAGLSMAAAGPTFDGSGSISRLAARPSAAMPAAGVSDRRGRFAAERRLDDAAAPPPPEIGEERDVTAYRGVVFMAIVAFAAAIGLMAAAGLKKDAAKAALQRAAAAPDPASKASLYAEALALYGAARSLLLLATLAAAAVVALGVILMTAFDQRKAGLVWVVGGGVLSVYLMRRAAALSEGQAEARQQERLAMEQVHEQAEAAAEPLTGAVEEAAAPLTEPVGAPAEGAFQMRLRQPLFRPNAPLPSPAPQLRPLPSFADGVRL